MDHPAALHCFMYNDFFFHWSNTIILSYIFNTLSMSDILTSQYGEKNVSKALCSLLKPDDFILAQFCKHEDGQVKVKQ